MRVTSLAPQHAATRHFMQEMFYIDRKTRQADLGALIVSNVTPSQSATFITTIEVFAVDAGVVPGLPHLEDNGVVVAGHVLPLPRG